MSADIEQGRSPPLVEQQQQQQPQEKSFIDRHPILCIAPFVIGGGLFLIDFLGNLCDGASNAFCKTIQGIKNGINTLVSPLVSMWRNLIMLFCLLGAALGIGGAMKIASFFGGKKAMNEERALAAEREGAEPVEITRADGSKELVLMDKNGKLVEGERGPNGERRAVRPSKSGTEAFNQQVRTNQAANQPSADLFPAGQNEGRYGSSVGVDENDDAKTSDDDPVKPEFPPER